MQYQVSDTDHISQISLRLDLKRRVNNFASRIVIIFWLRFLWLVGYKSLNNRSKSNTRNTCGIFIREYRFAARMSVQRSPVIALVCFPERHRRLNVANTGKPSRRTYRSHHDIHPSFVAAAIYANRIRLSVRQHEIRETRRDRSAAICY